MDKARTLLAAPTDDLKVVVGIVARLASDAFKTVD